MRVLHNQAGVHFPFLWQIPQYVSIVESAIVHGKYAVVAGSPRKLAEKGSAPCATVRRGRFCLRRYWEGEPA